jgi:hypothetical protein
MAVKLSALHAIHGLPPERSFVLISVRSGANPGSMVWLEGLGKSKKFNDLAGNWIHNLPACSIAPQSPTLPCAPSHVMALCSKVLDCLHIGRAYSFSFMVRMSLLYSELRDTGSQGTRNLVSQARTSKMKPGSRQAMGPVCIVEVGRCDSSFLVGWRYTTCRICRRRPAFWLWRRMMLSMCPGVRMDSCWEWWHTVAPSTFISHSCPLSGLSLTPMLLCWLALLS